MRISLVLVTMLSLIGSVVAQEKVLDKIAAVVNDEMILVSEVDQQAQYYAYQMNQYKVTRELWDEVLNGLISQKILLAKAKIDSIKVPTSQIEGELDQRIGYLVNRLGSEEAVRNYYKKSILQIKNELRENVRRERLVAMTRQKVFGGMTVTDPEVNEFFETYKDSLPEVAATVELSQIFIYPEATDISKNKSLQKITMLKDSLALGVPFDELARRHGEDGTAAKGGDLGWFKRGELVPQFESAAYALKDGETSGIVETRFGYHLIKMIERRGESINTRHILVRADRASLDHEGAVEKLSKWREDILAEREVFQNLAQQYSKDEFAKSGGYMGRIEMTKLSPQLSRIVLQLDEGEISQPAQIVDERGDTGYHIIFVQRKYAAHKMNLSDDYSEISAMALELKKNKFYDQWLKKMRSDIFVDVRVKAEDLNY